MEALLSVKGLRVTFSREGRRPLHAVRGLSYELHKGQTLAIVGESGCGKSVHALSILRLLPQAAKIEAEELKFAGEDLLKAAPRRIRQIRGDRVAMIFQEPMTSLNPVLKVGEQIEEALMTHRNISQREAAEKAIDLLKKVGIPDSARRAQSYPHQFSGGMRQRAMIAMSLSCEPDILIADEPTTALDVTIQAQILDLLESLQKESNMALILITHNLGVVAETADQVVVMYAGREVESAPADRLFAEPRHPYTRALLNSVPSLYEKQGRLSAISGQPPELSSEHRGCAFAPRCPQAMARCRESDPPLFALSDGRQSQCWLEENSAGGRAADKTGRAKHE